ncbi:hypothetical protein G7Y79_00070g096960 [Physcia stellaris]|nr:hypothetical protein G7Y79_00070g096960 [Physcia stellaris]
MPPVCSSKGRLPDCQKTGTQWRFVNIGGPQETKNEELRRMVRVNAARAHWRRQGKNRSNRQPAGDSGHQREKSKASLEFTQRDHDPMTGSQVEGIFSGYDMEEVSDGLEIVKLGEFGSKRSRFLRHKGFTKMVHSQNVTIGDQNDLRGSLQASIIPNPVTINHSTGRSPRHVRCLLSDWGFITQKLKLSPTQDSFTTKVWIPHVLQNPLLYLSTLTFATCYFNAMDDNYKGPTPLGYKGETIKCVNASLQCPKAAVSDVTIAAVTALAATEIIDGNLDGMRIHINALRKMVKIRGGLQSLGPITQQEMLYCCVMVESPHGDVDSSSFSSCGPNASVVPEFDLPHQLYRRLAAIFRDMQYVTKLSTVPSGTFSEMDYMRSCKIRAQLQHRLLSLRLDKAASEMNDLDFHLDICRIAALIYIPRALGAFMPPITVLQSLKLQLMTAFKEKEKKPNR